MKNEMSYTMKVIYWLAIIGLFCVVGYIGWEIFITVYGGIHS